MKNIPLPPKNSYLKRLIEKVESVIKRMRWKAFFFDQNSDDKEHVTDEKFGFKSRKCPPQNDEMDKFEADLMDMVKNIKFRNATDNFLTSLKDDINEITRSTKAFIPAGEARSIAAELKIDDRTECIAPRQAFITLKDHKENFANNPTCRLINPAKSELGIVSKKILDSINNNIRRKTALNQWKNTAAVLDWFKAIPEKHKFSFTVFDIECFYPSITENLLLNALNYAKTHTSITDHDVNIIMHCRKSLLFDNDTAWVKKTNNMFDVTMGSFDGAEICELVGLFLLSTLRDKFKSNDIGLYRDDGLALFKRTSGPQAERKRKEIIKHFKNHGLAITIQSNLHIVNFLDVTLNLTDGSYFPYRKPNNTTQYIDARSNHPPSILKQLPSAINRRISEISCNKKSFDKAKQHYEDALKRSGHTTNFTYMTNGTSTPQQSTPSHHRKNRQRKIIWFNPPYSRNVQTNVGKAFLGLITRHFPASHKYHKIFNKNTVKVSYSCMDNMERIIKKHNQKILNANQATTTHGCNCRKKATCPLENHCLTPSIVYNAKVTTTEDPIGKNYIGLTEGPFKQRYTQHTLSFRNRHYANSTELSKFIWLLKDNNTDFKIKWSILTSAAAYCNKSKRCNLCLAEKFFIIKAEKSTLLNKRSELVSKCRHENKFYLMNLKADHT